MVVKMRKVTAPAAWVHKSAICCAIYSLHWSERLGNKCHAYHDVEAPFALSAPLASSVRYASDHYVKFDVNLTRCNAHPADRCRQPLAPCV